MGNAIPRAAAVRVEAVADRDLAQTLLASHLAPFPTVNQHSTLYGVSQPVLQHSAAFADACRRAAARPGSTLTKLTRMEEGLGPEGRVALADRRSILRQIEEGFQALREANPPSFALPHGGLH